MITNLNDFRNKLNESIRTTYKGYTYDPFDDVDDDVIKIYHMVKTPDGSDIVMDWSSYSKPTQEEFELWIDLGMPDRMHEGLNYPGKLRWNPINGDDLLKIKNYIETK